LALGKRRFLCLKQPDYSLWKSCLILEYLHHIAFSLMTDTAVNDILIADSAQIREETTHILLLDDGANINNAGGEVKMNGIRHDFQRL
jgi:hypothetical protein